MIAPLFVVPHFYYAAFDLLAPCCTAIGNDFIHMLNQGRRQRRCAALERRVLNKHRGTVGFVPGDECRVWGHHERGSDCILPAERCEGEGGHLDPLAGL